MTPLAFLQPWHDFFLLLGTAAATLLGLLFVAASIAASIPNDKLGSDQSRALWSLPILLSFGKMLLICALALIPGQTALSFGGLLSFLAVGDLFRMVWVTRGMVAHHRTLERLEGSDWRWQVWYPLAVAVGTVGAGVALLTGAPWALFLLAGSLLSQLIVGIHNAWELADWLATRQ